MTNPFDAWRSVAWPYRFRVTLTVHTIAGGTPTDPNVAAGWLRTKTAASDELIREQIAKIMVEKGITAEEATKEANESRHLNGFRRDSNGLYIEGRQAKAMLKEAASVAAAADKIPARSYGKTNKGLLGFFAEHVQVEEDRIPLGVTEPTGIIQRFVHTWRGTGIQYEEYVEEADLTFIVATDWEFDQKFWAMLWLTAEQQGIGASRSQGMGRFTVTEWEPIPWQAG
jgi:hypothetical protein